MKWGLFYKREVKLWHKYFVPMFIAGMVVAFLSFFFEASGACFVIITSVGASAVLLTYKRRHHLTTLKSAIWSYLAASIAAMIIEYVADLFGATVQVKILLVVLIVSILIINLNVFHPPAISAGLSFILYEGPLWELFLLIVAILVGFFVLRLLTYMISDHLSMNDFWHELKTW